MTMPMLGGFPRKIKAADSRNSNWKIDAPLLLSESHSLLLLLLLPGAVTFQLPPAACLLFPAPFPKLSCTSAHVSDLVEDDGNCCKLFFMLYIAAVPAFWAQLLGWVANFCLLPKVVFVCLLFCAVSVFVAKGGVPMTFICFDITSLRRLNISGSWIP